MGGAHRPSPVDLPRPVHRRRRSRHRLRRLSSHTGTDRVLGSGTGGFGRGTDGRVQTRTNEQAEPVVTAGRRGQEIGQLLIGRVVPEAGTRLRIPRHPATGSAQHQHHPRVPRRRLPHAARVPAPTRSPAPAGRGRQALMDETAPRRIGCSASFELCRPTARASLHTRRSRVTPKGRRPGNITFGDSTGPGFMAAGSERHLALLGLPLRARGGPLRMGRCPGISRRALPRSAGSGLPGRSRPE